MESILRNVSDFQEDQKRWLEEKLGHQLQEDQLVMIRVLSPGVEPTEATRSKAMDELQSMVEQANANAAARGITAEEADAAIEEAVVHVRRHKP